ncbi:MULTISPECIES: hypothetical protein [Geobacillus]|nr:hypothetical protein [Geobacillus zalihae]
MMRASFHGIILAFGLMLPLGVQNVFIWTQGRSSGVDGTPCRRC